MGKFDAYAPFDGDGRHKVQPFGRGSHPGSIAVRNGTARMVIDLFNRHGRSCHSSACQTTWVVMAYLDHHGIKYEVKGESGEGSVITRIRAN